MRKKHLWTTGKIMRKHISEIESLKHLEEMGVKVENSSEQIALSEKVIEACNEYIFR